MPKKKTITNDKKEFVQVVEDAKKSYGEGFIYKASNIPGFCYIPSGVFLLDYALFGGIPQSLITIFVGWGGSGKTTIALRTMGEAQKKYKDKVAVLIDSEGTFDAGWAEKQGIDCSKLYVANPQSGEQAADFLKGALQDTGISIIVLDSIASLVPENEFKASAEDSFVGTLPRLVGRMLRETSQSLINQRKVDHRPAVIFVNQYRHNIGVFRGDPRVMPGGNATKYYSSVIIDFKNKEESGKDEDDRAIIVNNRHSFIMQKSKIGKGLPSGEFVMVRDPSHFLGIGSIDDAGVILAMYKRNGWLSGGGVSQAIAGVERKFRTREEMKIFIYQNPVEYLQMKKRLLVANRIKHVLPEFPPDEYLLG